MLRTRVFLTKTAKCQLAVLVKNTHAGISLLTDLLGFWCGWSFIDCLFFLHGLIYPVIDSNGPFCILLYLVGQYQAWHLSLPKYIVKGRRTDAEFFCYAALFFVVTLHPFSKFIHFILFFYFFYWTKIRYSDTLVIISSRTVEGNNFVRWKEKVLTYIAQYVTM